MENINSEVTKELIDVLKLKDISAITNNVSNIITPVIDINPKHSRFANIAKSVTLSATGAGIIYTIPADKEFFLTSAFLSINDDIASDNIATYIYCTTFDGTIYRILQISKPTTTAYYNQLAISFPFPIKLQSNSTIYVANAFTAGSSIKNASISGYTLDNNKI